MGKHRKVPPPPSIPGLVDAHCHLDYPPMADDVDATLARARAAGVEQVVHIACRREAFAGAVALIEAHPQVFAAVGVHPHDATTLDDATLAEIEAIVRRYPGRVVAVGETGLDYYYDHSPRDVQATAFERQIELARALERPLVLHIRDAHGDALRIVDRHPKRENPGIVHCFTGTADEARAWLDRGFSISLSGIVTFPTADDLRAAARICPRSRLLVETDAPFLAPRPLRGRKNEPANVAWTCAFLADMYGEDPRVLAQQTTANTRALLGLPAPTAG